MSTQGDAARMTLIEQKLTQLAVAVNNMATKRQVAQLNLIRQKEVKSLLDRATTLEASVAELETQVASLL